MSDQLHDRASKVFLEARRLPGNRRNEFLNQACRGDDALRREVESLLAHDQDSAFLESGIPVRLSSILDEGADVAAGDSIAVGSHSFKGFRLLRVLGEGGMGIVYLAEQEKPRRKVALKILRAGGLSPTMVRRFEHEVEMLARLQHPGIAQLYESGAAQTDLGPQMFFAMEYLDAVPITQHSLATGLDVRKRLELMAHVCDAVQFAHHKGIIHRDLKPSNILVTSDGHPKLVDFGVARLLDPSSPPFTALTQGGQLVGTLSYMSPEQLGGHSEEVDTRSDVFALGLVLYELLTGRQARPMATPPREGTPIPAYAADPPSIRSIDRALRGDVETIVERALERDRGRRYQSAAELAADIRRYLKDEPIIARPANRIYQFRKFIRRNRTLAAATALVLAALAVGAVGTAWQAREARRQADRATAINDFMRSMFVSVDPFKSQGDLTVGEMARKASADIPRLTSARPDLEAAFRYEVGSIFSSLGLIDEARQEYTRSLELRESLYGPNSSETLAVVASMGQLHARAGHFVDAESFLRRAYDGRKASLGEHVETCQSASDLSTALQAQGKLAEAEAVCREAWSAQQRLLGPKHPDTLATQVNLASIRRSQKAVDNATELLVDALDGLRTGLGSSHPNTLLATANLAQIYKDERRFAEAEPLYRAASDGLRQRLGDDHPDALIASANLAQSLWRQKKLDEAAALYEWVVPGFRKNFGDRHPHVLTTSTHYALVLKDQSRFDEAEALFVQIYEAQRTSLGEDHDRTRLVKKYLDESRAGK